MARFALRNAGGFRFLTLQGYFIVRQRQMPDGDTLSFAAAKAFRPRLVKTNIEVLSADAVLRNIRLQSIDAPEKSQPWGARSRDNLLAWFGFDPAELGLSDEDFSANGEPKKIAGWIATHGMDGRQRPLGYLFRKNPGFSHGNEIPAAEIAPVLKRSANYHQVTRGAAYPAFYENTDEEHAVTFQKAAQKLRASGKGLWAEDRTTTGFVPTKTALGHGGALIYPKFYRRVEDWKTEKPSAAAFLTWLKAQSDGKKLVLGAERDAIPLWKLFQKVIRTKVAVPYDVSKLWFSE